MFQKRKAKRNKQTNKKSQDSNKGHILTATAIWEQGLRQGIAQPEEWGGEPGLELSLCPQSPVGKITKIYFSVMNLTFLPKDMVLNEHLSSFL